MRCKNHYNVGGRVLFRRDNKFSRTAVLALIKTFQNSNSCRVPNYWTTLLVSWQINLFRILEGAEEKWRVQLRAPSSTSLTAGTLTPQMIICALTMLSTKNARKLALLNARFAFFKYTIRILLSREACYIIVFIINALWFVWLCVCNRPKQRSHLFCWQKLICTRIFFLLFSAETAFLSLEIGLAKSFTFIIFKVPC